MDHEEHKHEHKRNCCNCGFFKSFVLMIALSTHAIFEGIALGLTGEFTTVINIMLGLLCHKGPAAMSLGIAMSKQFKKDEEKRKAINLVILFALATPFGIGLGMLI
jgi:zinc transporter 1/2/3